VAESHEPSYYEIALTNRQVVVAFVILLICVLGAFFSGVWIGREGTVRAAQEQIVRNTPPPETKEGKNLEELEFFDKTKKGADATKNDAQERPSLGSTLLEDLGVKKKPAAQKPAATPPAATQEAAAAAPPVQPAPAPVDAAQARRERRKAARAAAAATAAQETPAPAPVTAPVATAPAATTGTTAASAATPPVKPAKTPKNAKTTKGATTAAAKGTFVIQVFSSSDQAQAERIRAKLVAGGQKAYLSPIERGGRTMYRVRVGPFKSRDEAQKVSEKVRKGYKLDTWVTE
jgi:hypothetical protein